MANCIICKSSRASQKSFRADYTQFECAGCGAFILTGTAVATVPGLFEQHPNARFLLRHLLRRMNPLAREGTQSLSSEDIERLIAHSELPNAADQCANLILLLGTESKLGEQINLVNERALAMIGAQDKDGLILLARHLYSSGHIDVLGGEELLDNGIVQAALTVPGWTYYKELQANRSNNMAAFMAMQFNEPNVERAYLEAFIPGAFDAGFTLQKLDDGQPAGLIDDQLRVRIRNSAFAIVDITHGNLGAYWEAGFAEGLGKPVIYTCEKSAFSNGASHFDTNHHLTVIWSLDDLERARRKLAATIRATLPEVAKMTD